MPATFTPEQISQILEEFFRVVGTRQYIGARYVPIFGRKDEDTIEWDNTAPYEPLTIVLYQGNSYTSRQFVPVGVEITNQEFWAITGNYNAQVEIYRRETAAAREVADNALTAANNAQADINTLLPKADFSTENTVKKYVDDSVGQIAEILPSEDFNAEDTVKDYIDSSVATVQYDIDTLLPKADFSAENTVKNYIDEQDENFAYSKCNPIFYGADNTGINDSTEAIRNCIEENKGGTVIFSPGRYLISDSLVLPYSPENKVSIEGNGASLIASGTFDAFFKVGGDRTTEPDNPAGSGHTTYAKNLYLSAENANVSYAFDITNGYKDFKLLQIESYRTTNGVRIGQLNTSFNVAPADVTIMDSLFYGNGSEYESYGIIANCTDNYIIATRLYGFSTTFDVHGYITAIACHGLLRWKDQDTVWDPYTPNSALWNQYYENTCFATLNAPCRFIGCYADSMYKMFDVNVTSRILITNCFYYNARFASVACRLFDVNVGNPQMVISNCNFDVCEPSDTDIEVCGFKFNAKIDTRFSEIKLNDNIVGHISALPINDLLKTQYHGQRPITTNFDADTWYVFACVPIADAQVGFNAKHLQIVVPTSFINLYAGFNAGGTSLGYSKISKEFAGPNVSNLTLGIYTNQNSVGNTEHYLCVKSSVANVDFGAQLESLVAGTNTINNYWTTGTPRGSHPTLSLQTKLTDVFPSATDPQITFSLAS